MCGIAGVIGSERYSKADVARMIESIAYRGMDEQDAIVLGPAILGHARLAVVDPENGGQPMSNHDDTVWVVFNGEIYNFVELRNDLKAKGYHFKSRCDTEVLVHLWREKGPAMLDDLIGMFAFCIWDTRTNTGFLARDRQGIKPLYLMDLPGGGFAFASEIKALHQLPGVTREIDDQGLALMHAFNYCPPPRTCYKGVSHMRPGSYLELQPDGTRRETIYWRWPLHDEKASMDVEEFAALFDDSIRLQMRFDVEGCLFLSGGVDSSVVSGHLLPQWNRDRLLAFGLDCREEGYGEFHLAEKVAEQFPRIDLRPIRYDSGVVPASIDAVLHHMDQPHGDFSFFLIRTLCEAAHEEGVIVAFNGDGPDEVLAGFIHNAAFLAEEGAQSFPLDKYFARICFMPQASRARVLTPEFNATMPDPVATFEDLLSDWRDLPTLEQITAYELTSLSPGNNLIKTDRMGAGMSIEGRSPFMDHRISEAMARLPADRKFRDGVTKFFLKEYGLRFFDREHMFRPKSMPTMPIGEWIKGPLAGWADDTLRGLDPSRYNVDGALALFEDHKAGRANHTRELRTLLMTSAWMRGF